MLLHLPLPSLFFPSPSPVISTGAARPCLYDAERRDPCICPCPCLCLSGCHPAGICFFTCPCPHCSSHPLAPSSRPEHHAPVFVMRSGETPVFALAPALAFLAVIPQGFASSLAPALPVPPLSNPVISTGASRLCLCDAERRDPCICPGTCLCLSGCHPAGICFCRCLCLSLPTTHYSLHSPLP